MIVKTTTLEMDSFDTGTILPVGPARRIRAVHRGKEKAISVRPWDRADPCKEQAAASGAPNEGVDDCEADR